MFLLSKRSLFSSIRGPCGGCDLPLSDTRIRFCDPLALQGSIFDGFVNAKFRIDFCIEFWIDLGAIWDGFWDNFGINFDDFGFILHHFFEHRFLIDFLLILGTLNLRKPLKNTAKSMFFEKSVFQNMLRCCIDFATIFSSFVDHFGIIFRHFFGIDFA